MPFCELTISSIIPYFKAAPESIKKSLFVSFSIVLTLLLVLSANILFNLDLKKRISFDPAIEFDEALKQVKQIASLRLKELNNKDL